MVGNFEPFVGANGGSFTGILPGGCGDYAFKEDSGPLAGWFDALDSGLLPPTSRLLILDTKDWRKKFLVDRICRTFGRNKQDLVGRLLLGSGENMPFFDVSQAVNVPWVGDDSGVNREEDAVGAYFASPPIAYPGLAEFLWGRHKLGKRKRRAKAGAEKPFGYDLESCEDLFDGIHVFIPPKDFLALDHYWWKAAAEVLELLVLYPEFAALLNGEQLARIAFSHWEWRDGVAGREGTLFGSILPDGRRGPAVNGRTRDHLQCHQVIMFAIVLRMVLDGESIEDIQATMQAVVEAMHLRQKAYGVFEGFDAMKDVPQDNTAQMYAAVEFELRMPDPRHMATLPENVRRLVEETVHRWEGTVFAMESGQRMPEDHAEMRFLFKDGRRKKFNIQEGIAGMPPAHAEIWWRLATGNFAGKSAGRHIQVPAWRFFSPILREWESVPPAQGGRLIYPIHRGRPAGVAIDFVDDARLIELDQPHDRIVSQFHAA